MPIRPVGKEIGPVMEILAGLAVASGLEQVAPRLCGYDTGPGPDYFPYTAGLALGFGLAYIAMMYIGQTELHPMLVLYDLAGTILVFFAFAFSHKLFSFLIVLTALCWLVVIYGLTSLYVGTTNYQSYDRCKSTKLLANQQGLKFDRALLNAFAHRFLRAGVVTGLAIYWYLHKHELADNTCPLVTLIILGLLLLSTWYFICRAMFDTVTNVPQPITNTAEVQGMIDVSVNKFREELIQRGLLK